MFLDLVESAAQWLLISRIAVEEDAMGTERMLI